MFWFALVMLLPYLLLVLVQLQKFHYTIPVSQGAARPSSSHFRPFFIGYGRRIYDLGAELFKKKVEEKERSRADTEGVQGSQIIP